MSKRVILQPTIVSLNIDASAGCLASHSNKGPPNAFSNPVSLVRSWKNYVRAHMSTLTSNRRAL